MTYQATIDYLFTQLPMFSKIGAAAYKKDLKNIISLCELLGQPQNKFTTIHIGGTNGKGSTSHMLASVLKEAGYRTGLYTSPHLVDFRERIKINGQPISQDFVAEFVDRIKPQIEVIEPSFFEITVAMAFDYFAKSKVEIAVIEVGLGGRLDSTNIIEPALSIITNIGYDHMNLLGNTLSAIAGEKAGIIKSKTPVIISESQPEVEEVFIQKAKACNAPLLFADRQRTVENWSIQGTTMEVEVSESHSEEHKRIILDLTGIYQTKNLLAVLEAVHILGQSGWNIQSNHLKQGLRNVIASTGFHGRWETVHDHPRIILDVSHNSEGITQVAQQLETTDFHALHIVLGIVKDKEVQKMLAALPKHASYYFTRAQIPRALPEQELELLATQMGFRGNAYKDIQDAVQGAVNQSQKDDLILICGSVFLVGEFELGKIRFPSLDN